MTLKVGKRAGHIYIGKNRNGLTTGQGRRPLIGMAEDCTFILGGYNRWSQEWPVRISDHFVTIALDNVKGGPDKNTYLKNVFFCKSWWGIYWYFTGQAFNGSVILSFGTPIIALFYYSFKLIPLLTLEVTVSSFILKLWCWIRLATVLQVFYAIWWGQDLATNSTVLIILWNNIRKMQPCNVPGWF